MRSPWLPILLSVVLLATVTCGGVVVCTGWWCVGWVPPPCSTCVFGASVAAGDLDGDGFGDAAVGAADRGLVVLLFGDGQGGVARERSLQEDVGFRVDFLRVGSIDDDPHPDLVLVDAARGEIRVLRGNGAGNFGVAGDPVAVGALGDVLAVVVGRIDGDGNDDVVVLDATGKVVVLRPDASGRLGKRAAVVVPLDFGPQTVDLALARIDADDHLDVAVLDRAAGTVTVLLGDGQGSFPVAGTPVAAGPRPVAITAGPLDGMPGADVAVVDGEDGLVRILFSNGDGSLSPSPQGPLPLPGARGQDLLVLPRPGAPEGPADLAVAWRDSRFRTLLVGFENTGNGVFTGPGLSVPVGSLGDWVATDLNGDDRMDLVVGSPADAAVGFALGGTRNR